MSSLAWPNDYVSSDSNNLNSKVILAGFEKSSGLTDLTPAEQAIVTATVGATIWSYPLNETYRLYNLDTISQAKENTLFKPEFAASWLNESSSPAPDASVLYMTSWLNLNQVDATDFGEQVLQLPANPDGLYYVLAVLDSYINTNGSFGPRDPLQGADSSPQYVLLAGPDSPYYGTNTQTVSIGGATLHVLQVDTPQAWITARIATDTLNADAMATTRDFINGNAKEAGSGFQLTSLKRFKATGKVPYTQPIKQSSTGAAVDAARTAWGSVPTSSSTSSPAAAYFQQVSKALELNPVPAEFSSTIEPARYQIWTSNQNSQQDNTTSTYQPPSALSADLLSQLNSSFAAIGLNLTTGFSQPSSWSSDEQEVFEQAYTYALNLLSTATTALVKGRSGQHNGWHITNDNVGVYPNSWANWLVRAGAAVEGGAANIPNDAVYPTTEIDSEGNQLTSTYTYRIALPAAAGAEGVEKYAPAKGFWSFTVYQPNPGNAYQPFLIENAIRNTAYSPINATATLNADGTLTTTKPGNWNQGTAAGTALLTGSSIGVSGLDANTIYYVKTADVQGTSLQLTLSSTYTPDFGSNGIPIGGGGQPGPAIELTGSAGSSVSFGWINPVSQLGSSQQAGVSGATTTLATEGDGSINLSLSSLAPATNPQNWLPTPQVSGSGSSNAQSASEFQMMARYYWPSTDDPSILDDKSSSDFYDPPAIERLGLNRIHTWDLLSQAATTEVLDAEPTFGSSNPLETPSPFSSDVVGALLDLRFLPDTLDGQQARVNYSYARSADYDNKLFFYAIDDITGSIDGLNPGESGYLHAAWSKRLTTNAPIDADNDSTSTGALQLAVGKLYAPIVNNGEGLLFTAFDSANASGYRHFNLLSASSFAFEDQPNGGNEHDRNDGILTITSIDL